MLGWLLYPTAECTTANRHDIRIGQVDEDGTDVSETDTGRVEEGVGFFAQWRDLIARCYDDNSIGQQASWKKHTALGLAGATVLFWLLGRLTRPRPASMDD